MLLHSQNMSVTHIKNFLEALEGEVLHTRTKMLLNHFKDAINNQLYTWAKYNPSRLSELNIEISFWLKCWKVYDCDFSITILGTYFSVVLCDILKTSESQKCIVIRIWNKFRSQTSNKKFWKKFLEFFWDSKWEIFPFFVLVWRTSPSRASKKFSMWVTDIFGLCNNILWLQALQRYWNHGVLSSRKNRTHVFEKTVPSPAFWILLLYVEFKAKNLFLQITS